MPFFARPYQSEVTQFLRQLDQQHPELEEKRKSGRARLWEKRIHFKQLRSFNHARVKQTGYVYYPNENKSATPHSDKVQN